MFREGSIWNYTKILFLEKYLSLSNGIIAGGCFKHIFANEKAKDIDIFFRNSGDFQIALNNFTREETLSKVYENDNAVSFRDKTNELRIDLVKKVFGNPKEIIQQFDFTVTKFCFYLEKSYKEIEDEFETKMKILFHEDFFEHLHLKRLVIDEETTSFPYNTLIRMFKYISYGFNPCRETKEKIIRLIKESNQDIDINRSMYDGLD